jgi:hypothetical protein
MLRWSNFLVWIPFGMVLGYLAFIVWQQNQYNTEQEAHNAEVIERLEAFRTVGPRFTAQDGDELCRDIRAIQEYVGLPERECLFDQLPNP